MLAAAGELGIESGVMRVRGLRGVRLAVERSGLQLMRQGQGECSQMAGWRLAVELQDGGME